MKVIFLDIDGVLNTSKTFDDTELEIEIDDFRVEFLKRIIDATDAKVVLSSSWKNYYHKVDDKIIPVHNNAIELNKILLKHGIKLFDIVPSCKCKADEINMYLSSHEVSSFVIIDDDSFGLMEFIGKGLIKTSNTLDGEMVIDMSCWLGLCEEQVEEAISILNNAKVKRR